MNLAEYATMDALMRQLFRGDRRPTGPDALAAHLRIQYPAWAHLDAGAAVRALYVLRAEGQIWEPTPRDVRDAIREHEPERIGDGGDFTVALERLAAAIAAWRDARRHGSQLPTEFVEQPDGSYVVQRGPGLPRWKEAAGPAVLEWLDLTGGIVAAAERVEDTTYRAQFRDWWQARHRRTVRQEAVEAAAAALPANVVASLASVTPALPADHAHHSRALGDR